MTAYVIGNGKSRQPIPLDKLDGDTYGCNGLYRDFKPTCLVSTDEPISRYIQNQGYAKHNRFHTRHVYAETGAKPIPASSRGWSSGPNAANIAIRDGHKELVLLGFDFGSTHSQFNNVYADTDFYRMSHETATFHGNWKHQFETLIKHHRLVEFAFIYSNDTRIIEDFKQYSNVKFKGIDEFLKEINNA